MAAMAQQDQAYPAGPHDPQQWNRNTFDVGGGDFLDDKSNPYDINTADHSHRPQSQSFPDGASVMSPTHQTWPDFSYGAEAAHYPLANAPTLYPDQGVSQLSNPDASQFANFGAQLRQWHQSQGNLEHRHADSFQGFPSETETIKSELTYDNHALQTPNSQTFTGLPMPVDSEYSHRFPVATAGSPQWSTSSSDAVEKIPRSGQLQSPAFKQNLPHLPRDGVRKKNARFDIPEGHNLQTIDELINRTDPSNEQALKELKQQKRLLRNRQAALDSRCRKKHHTEKLEEEKKHFLSVIDRLEDDLNNFRMNEQRFLAERQQWQNYSESLVREKEELVRQHTLETGDLRRKNMILKEESERFQSVAMSTQPSSAGVSSGFPDFEQLNMDSSPFEDFSFIDHRHVDADTKPQFAVAAQSKQDVPASFATGDSSATPGLLIMLLLCGAWVASKSTSSLSASVPRMPDDVRVASSAILESIYHEAGVQPLAQAIPDTTKQPSFQRIESAVPIMSSTQAVSSLDLLHRDLSQPTEQQQREQLFSLTPDQYNRMTTDNSNCDDSTSQPGPMRRRNLAEALDSIRTKKRGPVAEAYTRSLMKHEVPSDVVRQFARMMAENSE